MTTDDTITDEMRKAFEAITAEDVEAARAGDLKVLRDAAAARVSRKLVEGTAKWMADVAVAPEPPVHVLMPDPSISDAEHIHQRALKPDNPNVGKVYVARNMASVIGGLIYIRRREPHHERAAELFLNLYEGRYGRVSPAIDAGKVRVDTSIIGHDGEMVAAIDRTRRIEDAEDALGKEAFRFVVAVICLGSTVSDYTGAQGRVLDRQVVRFLDHLDRLAELWNMASRRVA